MNPVNKILYDKSKDRAAYLGNAFTPEQTEDWWHRSTSKQRAEVLRAVGYKQTAKEKEFIEYNGPYALPVMVGLKVGAYLGQKRK